MDSTKFESSHCRNSTEIFRSSWKHFGGRMAITIEQEQELELKQEALTVTQKAALVEITDQLTYNSASALLLEKIIPFRKRWKDYWETLRKPAYEAYQGIIDKFNEG